MDTLLITLTGLSLDDAHSESTAVGIVAMAHIEKFIHSIYLIYIINRYYTL